MSFTVKEKQHFKQLAMDIYDGHVFTSNHVPKHDESCLGMIFMPILLSQDKEATEKSIKGMGKNGFVYEYYNKTQTSRGVNGYPIFYSCVIVPDESGKLVWEYYRKYKKFKEAFSEEDPSEKPVEFFGQEI